MLYSELSIKEMEDGQAPGYGVPIAGFCIHEGRFKEIVEIPEEELNNVEKTIHNAQFRIDHSNSVRDVVGLVNYAKVGFDVDAQKPGVKYEALVKDDEIAGKIQQGLVNDVSIGFDLEPECSACGQDFRTCEHWFDEAHIIARNVNVFELSLVTRGADSEAYASAVGFAEQFEDKLQKIDKSKKEQFKLEDLVIGGKFMAEGKDGNPVDVNKVIEKMSAAEKVALEKENEAKELAAQLAQLKADQEALEAKNKALEQEKVSLSKERDDYKGKFEDANGVIDKQKLADHKEAVSEIVKLEVEKGITKEAEFDARVETLSGIKEEAALSVIKKYAEDFKKAPARSNPKINAIQGFNKFVKDGIEMDLDAFLDSTSVPEKVKQKFHQRMTHEVFRYDRVYNKDFAKELPGQSYMGFTLHEEDN
jgi:phage head maturation protease/cell division protein FtsB